MGSCAHNHAKATLSKPINRVRKGSVVTDTTKSVVLDRELEEEKRNPASRNRRESAARSAAGHRERKTDGLVTAATSGTRSIREASAQPACISGLKPSAYRAVDGRHTRCGMWSEGETSLPLFFPQTPYL